MAKKKQNATTFKILVFAVAVIFIAGLLIKFFFPNRYPAAALSYKVFGVDVSKHSGNINWQILKENNVAFAYLKATEGEDYIDPLYKQNRTQAIENSIILGSYHFFRFNKSGKKQALLFLKNASINVGDLLPVLDIEIWGNTISTQSPEIVIKEIRVFLTTIEQNLGVKPMIYTNKETFLKYVKGNFDAYPIWFCDLINEPNEEAPYWSFWQFSHKGKIEGSKYHIDFNVFRYSLFELKTKYTIKP